MHTGSGLHPHDMSADHCSGSFCVLHRGHIRRPGLSPSAKSFVDRFGWVAFFINAFPDETSAIPMQVLLPPHCTPKLSDLT